VGISTDFQPAQAAWAQTMGVTFPLVSDMERKTLQAYDFLETNPTNRLFRYSKRAYVIIDTKGTVRYKKILETPRELVSNDELLAELDKIR
jgi:peroxiredoxin